jgi:transposase InsO family protein
MDLWQSDITSFHLARQSRRVYLTVFLDDCSRYVVGFALNMHQRQDLVVEALMSGIARFGKPREVLTDQGRQYFAWRGKSAFQKLLVNEGIQHVVARAHHPETVGKCERLWVLNDNDTSRLTTTTLPGFCESGLVRNPRPWLGLGDWILRTSDRQVRRLMEEHARDGSVGRAALRADMDEKTARKYLKVGKMPSELVKARSWRTRPDPLETDWSDVVKLLEGAPDLEAVAVMDYLVERFPERYRPGQVRTLQRKLRRWRAEHGPAKRVFFPQDHRPGEAMQTDFTWATELGVTILGEVLEHLICHSVLPFSNWEWPTVCRSESMVAIKRGVQAAVFRLGRTPRYHQTDHSTGATHDIGDGMRGFNRDYLALMVHFGMEPRTIAVGEKEQNGDVESLNGAFKRRVRQALLLRGSTDFESVAAYEKWLQGVAEKANQGRRDKIAEDVNAMTPVAVDRLPEFTEEACRVRSWSTIRVKHNTYSVPSQLIGEVVRVRIFEDRIEVWYAGERREVMERLIGQDRARINYRHIIDSLVRKSAAFERYRFREALFPTLIFRMTYDRLRAALPERDADIEYLRILHLSARTLESKVEQALVKFLESGAVPMAQEIKNCVAPEPTAVPEIAAPIVSLTEYDGLLVRVKGVAS